MGKHRRVVWTHDEESRIVADAVEILTKRSDLSGLPLFREAMDSALPIVRRRRLNALKQVPWFEVGLDRARRTVEREREKADAAAVVANDKATPLAITVNDQLRLVNLRLDDMNAKLDRLNAKLDSLIAGPIPS